MPIEEVSLGGRCISALGSPGIVTKIIAKKYASQGEDNEIQIDWENGKVSCHWHFHMDSVEYLGVER